MKEKLNVVAPEVVPIEKFKITPEQENYLPVFLEARERANAAIKAQKQASEALALPRFEGKKVNVQLVNAKGRILAVVEVRWRNGYPVEPGWQNRLVALG